LEKQGWPAGILFRKIFVLFETMITFAPYWYLKNESNLYKLVVVVKQSKLINVRLPAICI
jgi:hypothetical protein